MTPYPLSPTYVPSRFAVLMRVSDRIERYTETDVYADALESLARVRRCYPGRVVFLRDRDQDGATSVKAAA